MNDIMKNYDRINFIDENKNLLFALIEHSDMPISDREEHFVLSVFGDKCCVSVPLRLGIDAKKVWRKSDAFKNVRQRRDAYGDMFTIEKIVVIIDFDQIRMFEDADYVELEDIMAVCSHT